MRANGRVLDILRVNIAPLCDDQIAGASGNIEFAARHKAEIARFEVSRRPVSGQSAERPLGLFAVRPIASGNRRARQPNLADFALRASHGAVGFHDRNLNFRCRRAATRQTSRRRVARFGRRGAALFQTADVEVLEPVSTRSLAGYKQRRLGKSVARQDDSGAKAGLREIPLETFDTFGPHWLGAVHNHFQGRQVQSGAILVLRTIDAEIEGKIRRCRRRRPVAGNCIEPAMRALKEVESRHQDASGTQVNRVQNQSNQAHIVIGRQPSGKHGIPGLAGRLHDAALVRHQIGMSENAALRGRSRAGSVLQYGHRHRSGTG